MTKPALSGAKEPAPYHTLGASMETGRARGLFWLGPHPLGFLFPHLLPTLPLSLQPCPSLESDGLWVILPCYDPAQAMPTGPSQALFLSPFLSEITK